MKFIPWLFTICFFSLGGIAEERPKPPVIRGFTPALWVAGDQVYRRIEKQTFPVTPYLEKTDKAQFEKAFFEETEVYLNFFKAAKSAVQTKMAVFRDVALSDAQEEDLGLLEMEESIADSLLSEYQRRQQDEHHYWDVMTDTTDNANKSSFKLGKGARDFMENRVVEVFNRLVYWSRRFMNHYEAFLIPGPVSSGNVKAECSIRRLGPPLLTEFYFTSPVFPDGANRNRDLAWMLEKVTNPRYVKSAAENLRENKILVPREFDASSFMTNVTATRIQAAVEGAPVTALPRDNYVFGYRTTDNRQTWGGSQVGMTGPIDYATSLYHPGSRTFTAAGGKDFLVSLICWNSWYEPRPFGDLSSQAYTRRAVGNRSRLKEIDSRWYTLFQSRWKALKYPYSISFPPTDGE